MTTDNKLKLCLIKVASRPTNDTSGFPGLRCELDKN